MHPPGEDRKPEGGARKLEVSLEGLDLSDDQVARLESTMRTAVLTELARFDLAGGMVVEPIGKGKVVGDWLINGIIVRDLGRMLKERGINR